VQAQLIGGVSTITADYGGIQNTTYVTMNPPAIDYIIITNTPDGTALDTVVLDIGGNVTAYASGYNTTYGYVDLVEVAWTDNPDLGTFDNDTGTNTVFTAGFAGGSTNITGQNTTLLVSDNFTVVINDPTLDYIIITDAPNGNELTTVYIFTGGEVIAYASGYNNTGTTYVGLVEVDWTDNPNLGTFDNDTGTNTVFTAGQETGLTTITGQNATLAVNDTFDVDIAEEPIHHVSGYSNTDPTNDDPVEIDWTDFLDLGTFDRPSWIFMVILITIILIIVNLFLIPNKKNSKRNCLSQRDLLRKSVKKVKGSRKKYRHHRLMRKNCLSHRRGNRNLGFYQ
jgi:hypothetical protein